MSQSWWPDTTERSEFLAPPVIVAGPDSCADAPRVLAERLGFTHGTVLVVADDIVLEKGLAAHMLESLEAAGLTTVVSSGFGSEPTDALIDAAADRARGAGAGVVIGIGGGSALDSSKLLALLLRNEGSARDWLGAVNPPNGVSPLLLIPTTCGTGSEATRIAMVTVDGAKRAASHVGFVPQAIFLDPRLLATLPGSVIASTGMDALAHAVESVMSTSRSPMTVHHALRAIELLVGSLEEATKGDGRAAAQCLWGSHLAGQALNAGVVVGHSLAYCLAWEMPMAHGTSCALALPYCMAYNRDGLEPDLEAALASALTLGRACTMLEAARETFAFAERLGLPTTLKAAGITEPVEAALAARCVAEYPRPTNPVLLDAAAIEELLMAMRTGDLDAAFRIPTARRADGA